MIVINKSASDIFLVRSQKQYYVFLMSSIQLQYKYTSTVCS